jgi:4-hydroxy-tetrahydrodipicolinate synthase
VDCGAHGVVWPVNASGFAVLTDEERIQGMEVVVEQIDGRIPVVLGVQGLSTPHASTFAAQARSAGADAVIAMTPYVQPLEDDDDVLRYYEGIAKAARLPVFIQNHMRGSVLSIETMARVVKAVEHVDYIKEETFPVTHMITGALEACGPHLKSVFGGAGGRYLLLEHPRGVAGQMPGCHLTDVVVRLWNALEAGDDAEAKRIYGMMAPIFALETLRGTSYPEILRRRGVIKTAHSRSAVNQPTVDEYDHRALDDILRDLEPLFTWSDGPLLYGPPEDMATRLRTVPTPSEPDADTFDQVG